MQILKLSMCLNVVSNVFTVDEEAVGDQRHERLHRTLHQSTPIIFERGTYLSELMCEGYLICSMSSFNCALSCFSCFYARLWC